MKLYSTKQGIARETSAGELEILDIEARDLGELLKLDPTLDTAQSASAKRCVPREEAELLAPVPVPGCIYCVGANYADIVLPEIAPAMVDYEIEVAAVIGCGGSNLSVEQAQEAVAGLTLANDVSARDLQRRAMSGHELEFGHAKGLDGFKPMGPCLVTLDEFSEPLNSHIEARVNGEVKQSAELRHLIHDIPACVSYISRFHTLKPGDVILTGSPAGVGFFQGQFLKAGDQVEMSASGIGIISNRVVAAA